MGRRNKGFIVVASVDGRRFWWPYRQLRVEDEGLLVRSWPIAGSPILVPKERIHFLAVGQVWQVPYVSAFGKYGVLIASFRPHGNWEALFSALQESGYRFEEYPPVLPDLLSP
jgi:hypothetical protein